MQPSAVSAPPAPALSQAGDAMDLALDLVGGVRAGDVGALEAMIAEPCRLREPLAGRDLVFVSGNEVVMALRPYCLRGIETIVTLDGTAAVEHAGWREGRGGLVVIHIDDEGTIAQVVLFGEPEGRDGSKPHPAVAAISAYLPG